MSKIDIQHFCVARCSHGFPSGMDDSGYYWGHHFIDSDYYDGGGVDKAKWINCPYECCGFETLKEAEDFALKLGGWDNSDSGTFYMAIAVPVYV